MSDKLEYIRNRERYRARAKTYYEANRERIKKNARLWLANNRERAQSTKAAYRATHRAELAQQELKRYYSDHAAGLARNARFRHARRDKQREWARYQSEHLTDVYVREQLSKGSAVSAWEWPQSVVDAKREYIRLKRLQHRTTNHGDI